MKTIFLCLYSLLQSLEGHCVVPEKIHGFLSEVIKLWKGSRCQKVFLGNGVVSRSHLLLEVNGQFLEGLFDEFKGGLSLSETSKHLETKDQTLHTIIQL